MQTETGGPIGAPVVTANMRLATKPRPQDSIRQVSPRRMYVPAWPGLNPALLLRTGRTGELPFPLDAPHRAYAYVARGLIYLLFRALGLEEGGTVLVPDYHHGNE